MKENKYDIIVIGGGHAGIEAAFASAKMNCKTALITMNLKTIGKPSCNPSIGGTAKGHLVKEIDALGGAMGFLADKAGIHFKLLNKSKGPAIWSPRAQIDKDLYPLYAYELLRKTKYLDRIADTVTEILIERDQIRGIKVSDGSIIYSEAIVFCAGTFLNGVMHTGMTSTKGGRMGEPASKYVSDLLNKYGFDMGRLKTGTPPRVFKHSIDFSKVEISPGDDNPKPFSHLSKAVRNRIVCWSSSTTDETHNILKKGFDRSPMFTGRIQGTGPRYCPSIEDKVNRFSERDGHKILLEPEGLNTESVYVNGFSTSLPEDIQLEGLRSIKGLEKVEIARYGYAIEYDFFFPYQLKFTMETKAVSGLFFAGQINGTSGYEEAASQGLIAGINAALKVKNEGEFSLKRSESYIGVLIDDLVNKSTEEPYRIFTSLAEYRLLLRQDNADERLMKYGNMLGLISDSAYSRLNENLELMNSNLELSKSTKIKADIINQYFNDIGETAVKDTTDIYSLTKRSNAELRELFRISEITEEDLLLMNKIEGLTERLQTEIKYEGYISRQKRDVEYFLENEFKRIPADFDYAQLVSLSNEAKEKLIRIKPASLGQASRISGVSASDISVISVYLKS